MWLHKDVSQRKHTGFQISHMCAYLLLKDVLLNGPGYLVDLNVT